jgi:adenylate kinase family enzyme
MRTPDASLQRIAIIGNAGGGKSVLARALGRALALPVHSIDDVQWRPGWTRAPAGDVAAHHAIWLAGDRWIIDGWGDWELIAARFAAADAIVVVDFPLHIHYRWAFRRQVEVALGLRRDWPPAGCDALSITRRLLAVMRYVHRELRPTLLTLIADERFRDRVVHLRSPSALRQWRTEVTEAASLP